jgi:ribulose-5-phosphate 4-epimerase/fuculose-1-phosphate aldolase
MMSTVAPLKTSRRFDSGEWQMRVDLAAAFRLTVLNNWHEGVANHFSLATEPDGSKFLMNARWMHFSRVSASNLIQLDSNDPGTMQRPDAPDITAWCLHGRLHKNLPHARCILHVHPKFATAVAALQDPEIKPIDQNTARFYNRIAYDLGYSGMANSDEEGDRLSRILGNRSVMMMGNHGVLVVGKTVAEAYDKLFYLERACQTLVLAYSTGQPLHIMSHEVAERTAREWEDYGEMDVAHFEEMKLLLDARDATYAE